MSWLIDGRTFAKKVKNPSYGTCRDHVSRGVLTECPSCGHGFEQSEVWPGFPSGVKFDPSDQEILEHLAAQVGISSTKPHPFITEFIPTINVEGGICYTHPEKLPGIRRDGGSAHFFHIPPKAYTTGSRKRRKVQTNEGDELRWHKTGRTRPVIENGKQLGCKKIMVLYTSNGKQAKPDKTNWVMHQYHLGVDEEEKEGEVVVSKVFYQTQPRQMSKANDEDLEGTEFELQEGPRKNEDFELTEIEVPMGSRKNEGFELTDVELWKASRINEDIAAPRQAEVLDGSGNNEDFEQTQVELADGSRNDLSEISIASPNIDFIESSNVVSLNLPATPNTLDISHESEVNGLDVAQITVKLDRQDKKRNHAQILSEFDKARNDDTISAKSSQEERSLLSDSQLFSGSLDAELLKLLCNENLKALGEGDAVNGLKNIIAEASSSQDRFSLDKIFLGTPPELLESLMMNSQGTSSEDWLEKLRLFGDSQRTDDFNLSEFLQNSQSQQ